MTESAAAIFRDTMTVFVGIASPAAELATLLGKPTPPGNATPSLIISKVFFKYTRTCMIQRSLPCHQLVPDDTLVSLIEDESANDKTASLFQLVLSFLDGMDVQDVAKLADRFTACLEKDVNNAELRLGLLIRLCNAVAVASIKARVFTSLLKYSLRSNLSASVLQSCSHIDDWTKEWALDANAQLQLMAQVAAIYAANGRDQDAHKIRVRILSLQLSDPVPHDVLSEHTAHVIAHVRAWSVSSVTFPYAATGAANRRYTVPGRIAREDQEDVPAAEVAASRSAASDELWNRPGPGSVRRTTWRHPRPVQARRCPASVLPTVPGPVHCRRSIKGSMRPNVPSLLISDSVRP